MERKTIGIIIALLTIVLLVVFTKSPPPTFPDKLTEDQECEDDALFFLSQVFPQDLNSEKIYVQKVKCFYGDHVAQRELIGTYVEDDQESKPIYFHEIAAGWAASEQDSYEENCLIINNQTIVSKVETAAEQKYVSPARCAWQEQVP